jgi:hypothetical protein
MLTRDLGMEAYVHEMMHGEGLCHGKSSPVRGSVTPLPVHIYRGLLPLNLQLTRASKTAIPLRDRLVDEKGQKWEF